MIRLLPFSLLIAGCLLFQAGGVSAQAPSSTAAQIPNGTIIEKVICAKNPAQSYAVYVPSKYTSERAWPILYAFDPGARGSLPVNRFQEAAEKYGWIVVGSNNSQNGSMQQSLDAWVAMWDDTHQRFAIDKRRVYVTGFSGGARVAIYFARACSDCVSGVIACGAGFPNGISPSPDLHFTVFAIAGFDDFNFPEIRKLDEALAKAGITHRIEFFDGRHEWPPAALANEGVEWMELQAIKSGKRQRNDKLIDDLWQKEIQRAKALEETKRTLDAYRVYAGMVESFNGLHQDNEIREKARTLAQSREVKDSLREERRQLEKQQELTDQLNALIVEGENAAEPVTGNRLRAMILELRTAGKAANDTSERRIARRVVEGLVVQLFEEGMDELQRQKRYGSAARSFQMVSEINPDRPGAFYYMAAAYALNGEKKKALEALQSAIQKGFTDRVAVTSNTAFDSIRTEPLYLHLIQNLK
ncbi:MAG: dienelactone hydrolase family protein [Acidobacteriota bacterium]|nr:dienelactone hydrolase family protein [Acidobacteriota bacterium]